MNSAGSGSSMSKMRCVASSLGRPALIDTKKAFIDLTSWVISPSVHFVSDSLHLVSVTGWSAHQILHYVSTSHLKTFPPTQRSSTGRIVYAVSALCG